MWDQTRGSFFSLSFFFLCSEGLNWLIQRAVSDETIRGFSLCKNGPRITYFFFADDSLLFCRANLDELNIFQGLLSLYEKASDQQINREKTTLFFSKCVSNGRKEEIKNLLGVPEIKEHEKYLGLLAVVQRHKKASLNYIKERIWNKLQSWKENLLSQAGREDLLKSMVQTIPTFDMSCFKLPIGLCHEIEMLI